MDPINDETQGTDFLTMIKFDDKSLYQSQMNLKNKRKTPKKFYVLYLSCHVFVCTYVIVSFSNKILRRENRV